MKENITLQRSTGVDWVDSNGVSYDAMGSGAPSDLIDMEKFKMSIVDHQRKADVTIIDMRTFNANQVSETMNYAESVFENVEQAVIFIKPIE